MSQPSISANSSAMLTIEEWRRLRDVHDLLTVKLMCESAITALEPGVSFSDNTPQQFKSHAAFFLGNLREHVMQHVPSCDGTSKIRDRLHLQQIPNAASQDKSLAPEFEVALFHYLQDRDWQYGQYLKDAEAKGIRTARSFSSEVEPYFEAQRLTVSSALEANQEAHTQITNLRQQLHDSQAEVQSLKQRITETSGSSLQSEITDHGAA